MKNERTGRFEIHITHNCSSLDNLKKTARIRCCGDEMHSGAIVEIRGEKAGWRTGHECR